MTRAALRCLPPLLSLACVASGVPETELPAEPIAISYRTQEEARRRVEDWLDAREGERPSEPGEVRPARLGRADLVASEDDLDWILSGLFGGEGATDDSHLGRLALLHPRTREVEVIGAARRGAIPLAWSSDHERLLFSQPDPQGVQLYEYALADSTVRMVTHGPWSHAQGCYAPEGRIVAAVVDTRETPYRSHIAISGPGGRSPFERLTDGPADHSPACRPGSGGVAFVREDPPRADLYYLEAAGSEGKRLAPGRHPAFSPDGGWLVFAAPHQRELRLWRIRPDGSARAPVGRGIRHEARPAVSPDGLLVAYVAAEEEPWRHLYLRRMDGSGDRILFATGDGEYPVW